MHSPGLLGFFGLLGMSLQGAADTGPAPGAKPAASAPTSLKCARAPKSFEAEIERLLQVAGEHATSSGACADASGVACRVEEVWSCEVTSRESDTRTFQVHYQFIVQHEGDGRGCRPKNVNVDLETGQAQDSCDRFKPQPSDEKVVLTFRKTAGGYTLVVPERVPGMERTASTPLTQAHDTDCYGKKPPFSPREVSEP
jgi:hypothetical protein